MENPVILFGAKGIGKVALEIFQSNGVVVYCFLEDDATLLNKEINGVTVLGNTEDETYLKLLGKKCEAFVASDDSKWKNAVIEMLVEDKKVMPVNALHKNTTIASSALLGHGNLVQAGVVLGAGAKVGNHNIIGANSVLDFDVELSDFIQIGAGSVIGSSVKVAKGAFIGSGVTVVSGVSIGKNARIGAGSVVVAEVKDGETVFGNPAAKVK